MTLQVKSRKAIGSIIAVLFIVSAIVIAFALIEFGLRTHQEQAENQQKVYERQIKAINIAKSVEGTWHYDYGDSVLTINIRNNYVEPVIITGIVILYVDGSYEILKDNLATQLGSRLLSEPITLPHTILPGETLTIKLNTLNKEPASIRFSTGTSEVIAASSAKKYVPPMVENITLYSIVLAPVASGEGTVTTKGYDLNHRTYHPSSIIVHKGADDPNNDITYVYAENDGLVYKVTSGKHVRSNWLIGWHYRKPILINNTLTTELPNYQIRIELNSSNFDFTKAKSDGSDIRFSLDNGITLIPYWIEKWDNVAQEAILWVKVPNIPAAGITTIYVYYGNPDATYDINYYGLTKVMEQLPANDEDGYKIYYQEWIMPINGIIGGGTAQNWHGDDEAWDLNLPFGFPYYNEYLTKVYVCSNGFISAKYYTDYSDSLDELKERKMIAPFWEDLMTILPNEDIYIRTGYSDEYGEAIIIRWYADFFWLHGIVNVELVLYRNGLVRFNYGHIDGFSNDRPTIGLSLGDNIHYTISSYNDKPADWYDHRNSVMFWPRKKADVEPICILGAEETPYIYVSEAEADFDGVISDAVGLDFTVTLAFNVSSVNVEFYLWNWLSNSWDFIHSETVGTGFSEIKFSTLSVGKYLLGGTVKLSINVTHGASFEEYLDYIGLAAYSPTRAIIYIGVGGSNEIYKYVVNNGSFEGPIIAEYAGLPIVFGPATSMDYDGHRNLLWVVYETTVYYYNITDGRWYIYYSPIGPVGNGCSLIYLNNKLYVFKGGNSDELYIFDLSAWGSPPDVINLGFNIGDYSVTESDGQYIYILAGGGSIDFYRFDPITYSIVELNSSPTAYAVGLAFDSDRNRLWLIGKGGGLHYYSIAPNTWHPVQTQIPYTPLSPGNRLEYFNNRLYHVRDDDTRELWIIYVGD